MAILVSGGRHCGCDVRLDHNITLPKIDTRCRNLGA
jgi:hypothetical protein